MKTVKFIGGPAHNRIQTFEEIPSTYSIPRIERFDLVEVTSMFDNTEATTCYPTAKPPIAREDYHHMSYPVYAGNSLESWSLVFHFMVWSGSVPRMSGHTPSIEGLDTFDYIHQFKPKPSISDFDEWWDWIDYYRDPNRTGRRKKNASYSTRSLISQLEGLGWGYYKTIYWLQEYKHKIESLHDLVEVSK